MENTTLNFGGGKRQRGGDWAGFFNSQDELDLWTQLNTNELFVGLRATLPSGPVTWRGAGSGGWVASSSAQRLFKSLQNGSAYRERPALLAAPAWVASTKYGTGSVVQNGGNVYLCINSYGASATSGGPSVTTDGPITDGEVKWLHMGPAVSPVADDDAPVVTFGTTHASTTRRYNPLVAADAAAFWFTGDTFSQSTPWGGGSAIAGNNQVTFSVEFCTDAPIISFNTYINLANASLTDAGAYNMLINGRRLYPVGGVQPGFNLTPGGLILDFSAKPRKVRRIRVYMARRSFSGIGVNPQYTVWAPKNPNRYRLAVEGDSITQGANPNNSSLLDTRAARLAGMLGCDDVWSFAVGSTGFINAGGGSTVISRASSVIATAPDVLYIAPINNDVGNDGTYNTTTRKAAYKQYFGIIRAALPNCVIIAGGGYGTGSNNISTAADSAYQVEQDMKAAVVEFADSNVIFMPTISDASGRWIVGDGNIGTTSNTNHGNSNRMIGDGAVDTLHPNQRFLDYIQWREFYGIVSALDKLQ